MVILSLLHHGQLVDAVAADERSAGTRQKLSHEGWIVLYSTSPLHNLTIFLILGLKRVLMGKIQSSICNQGKEHDSEVKMSGQSQN